MKIIRCLAVALAMVMLAAWSTAAPTRLPAPVGGNSANDNGAETAQAGNTNAAAGAADAWGPAAVWSGGSAFQGYRCPRGGTNAECLEAAMRNSGATPEAIAFARAEGFQEYLKDFRFFGRVSLGTVWDPFNADVVEFYVLLNGTPSIVDVSQVAEHINARSNPELARLLAGNPLLGMDSVLEEFAGERAEPGGGQRFLFRFPVHTCLACQPVARPTVAYDFSPNGHFVGTVIIDAGIGS